MVNAKIKRMWVRALRGKKFRQGKGQLCEIRDDKPFYCCLGVLEELAKREGVIDGYDRYNGALDHKTQKWAELDSPDPKLGPRSNSRKASWLNDHRLNFQQIADRIERYL